MNHYVLIKKHSKNLHSANNENPGEALVFGKFWYWFRDSLVFFPFVALNWHIFVAPLRTITSYFY